MPDNTTNKQASYADPMYVLPGELEFYIPGSACVLTALNCESNELLYRQLICWCLIQRYRYYILQQPIADDYEYDNIEFQIENLEHELCLNAGAGDARNKYSPTRQVGSTRKEDYPPFIRALFL